MIRTRRTGIWRNGFGALHVVLLAALLLFDASPARAEDDRAVRARETFEEGELHYRMGRFRQALARYGEALELARRASIVFNIAQCHRQLGEHERALFFYRLYLSDAERERPGEVAPYDEEVRRRIAELRDRLRQRRETGSNTRPAAETPRITAAAVPATQRCAPTPAPPPLRRDRGLLGLGIGAALLAAGAEAVALTFTVKANDAYSDTPEFGTHRGVAIAGHVAAGICTALGTAALVLYLRARPERPARAAAALLSPGGVRF